MTQKRMDVDYGQQRPQEQRICALKKVLKSIQNQLELLFEPSDLKGDSERDSSDGCDQRCKLQDAGLIYVNYIWTVSLQLM